MLETFIAAGAGAAAVVFIDWVVKYYLHKKKTFQEAISIQLALHQMLVVCIQIKIFYNDKKDYFIKFYAQEKLQDPEKIWDNFRHIDFSSYSKTFDIIGFDWDITQFLSSKENKTRKILKYLIRAHLSYQSLMSIIKERNELLWHAYQKIESARNSSTESNLEYKNNNLEKIITLPINEKLKGITDKYVETIENMITDCNKAFNILSTYIPIIPQNANFRRPSCGESDMI